MPKPSPGVVITALGITQILAWGSSFYLPAVLAKPIAADTGWSLGWVVGGLSVGLLAAGLVAPRIGRTIDIKGGHPVLVASSILLAAGLATLALAHSLPVYLMAWLVMGLGMGSGLYDAGFATLGRPYGRDARRAITTLTLWGGFASTVCWPLSAWLVEHFGWRGACATYAAIHVLVSLPLHAFVVPGIGPVPSGGRFPGAKPGLPSPAPLTGATRTRAFALLTTILTLGAVTASMIGVHLLTFLQARGLGLAAAVALGALVGPFPGWRLRHRDDLRPPLPPDLDHGGLCRPGRVRGPASPLRLPNPRGRPCAVRRGERNRLHCQGHPAPRPVRPCSALFGPVRP
jgi:MFS family permease